MPAEHLTDIAADPRGVRRGLSRTTGGRVGHGAAAAPGQLSGHGPADHPGAAQLRRPIVARRTAGRGGPAVVRHRDSAACRDPDPNRRGRPTGAVVSELASFLPIAVRAWTTYERHPKPRRRRRTAPP